GSARGRLDGSRYLDERGIAALQALDAIALAHDTTVAAVALAWLRSRPTVVAPIASARTPEQLAELLPMQSVALSEAELARLDAV
ncbi:MAG TPA: aldo/keto reductase, partial [Solirubrobacteraceae bacterium]|nr:aldo/keto reductase [Solirubrobacteraceae bacterium]